MNKSHSTDSLDTGSNDIIRSSSASTSSTDFSSDEEPITDNSYLNDTLLTERPQKSILRDSVNSAQISAKQVRFKRYNDPIRHADLLASIVSVGQLTAKNNTAVNQSLKQDTFQEAQESLSTPDHESYSRLIRSMLTNQEKERLKDLVSALGIQDVAGVNDRLVIDRDEDSENIEVIRYSDQFIRPANPMDAVISGTTLNRKKNNVAARMCSRLLECRNLIEAIEFVDQNRDTIDSLTSIITREAPAFRNYDIDNYQIDHTVKESFNPEFWSDREPIVTTADGNCQYHAVSLSLTGCETYTPEVRLATAVAVIDNRDWFDSVLKLIDRGTVLDLVYTIAKSYSWGDETTLKAVAVAIKRRIFLYTCNSGKKDFEMVKSLSKEELLDAFKERKYRGGTGIHTYADPLIQVNSNNYIMLFHKSEHFIAVLPTSQQLTTYEPYNPIVPVFN